MESADRYAARIDTVNAQRQRVVGEVTGPARWDRMASRFALDPRRELDPNLAAVAEYVRPGDTILDVGGGAGRVSLPLGLHTRAREVINVEPSAGMADAFERLAREAGIEGARTVRANWPASGVEGDVTLVYNVTYFIREIVPFVEALVRATRRRVIISIWSVPPPAQNLPLFELVYGEKGEAVPGHRELLPVLWDLGILPEIRVLQDEFRFPGGLPQTPDEAIAVALMQVDRDPQAHLAERRTVEQHFDRLFRQTEHGFIPLWRPDAREMLITWET